MILDYPGGSNVITRVLLRGRQAVVGDVTREGGAWSDVREGHKPKSAGSLRHFLKSKGIDLPLKPPEGTSPVDTLTLAQ